MRAPKSFMALALTSVITGCSSMEISAVRETPAQAEEAETGPSYDGCVRLAAERADDALMAGYVDEGSPEQKAVYDFTYGKCVAWVRSH